MSHCSFKWVYQTIGISFSKLRLMEHGWLHICRLALHPTRVTYLIHRYQHHTIKRMYLIFLRRKQQSGHSSMCPFRLLPCHCFQCIVLLEHNYECHKNLLFVRHQWLWTQHRLQGILKWAFQTCKSICLNTRAQWMGTSSNRPISFPLGRQPEKYPYRQWSFHSRKDVEVMMTQQFNEYSINIVNSI